MPLVSCKKVTSYEIENGLFIIMRQLRTACTCLHLDNVYQIKGEDEKDIKDSSDRKLVTVQLERL